MSVKTRYLQLSDTVIMEYCMRNIDEASNDTASNLSFIMASLEDGHYAIFSPAIAEVELDSSTSVEGDYKK